MIRIGAAPILGRPLFVCRGGGSYAAPQREKWKKTKLCQKAPTLQAAREIKEIKEKEIYSS